MSRIAELNGVYKRDNRKSVRKPKRSVRARRWTTIAMGVGIPALSLAMSSIGGRLLVDGHFILGTASLGLCGVVMAVSLSHLAWAVRDITRASNWQSWLMAVAVDATLVLGELSLVHGFDSLLVPCVMVAVAIMSAWLNCFAFLADKRCHA
jgi:hypothetical protein